MKNFRIALLALFAALAIVACDNTDPIDDNPGNGGNNNGNNGGVVGSLSLPERLVLDGGIWAAESKTAATTEQDTKTPRAKGRSPILVLFILISGAVVVLTSLLFLIISVSVTSFWYQVKRTLFLS